MSKWDKLLTRICALSKDLRFDELRKVLESYGYVVNYPPSKDGWACNWLLQYKRNLFCRFSWTLIAGILPSVPLHRRVVDNTRLIAFRIYRNLSLLF